MKKILRILLPVVIVLILIAAVLFWFLRPGEVVLSVIRVAEDGVFLTQVCEKGMKELELGSEAKFTPVFSPNGRYVAVNYEDARFCMYDLQTPETPAVSEEGWLQYFQPTDSGLLVYRTDALYCHDGEQAKLVDARQTYEGGFRVVNDTVYYYREVEGRRELCACDLPDGTPQLIGEGLTLYRAKEYEGKQYLILARERTISTERNLQIFRDFYRYADGELTLLAEDVTQFAAYEPISGTLLYRVGEQQDYQWYCSIMGETREFLEAVEVEADLTPRGNIYLLQYGQLTRQKGHGEAELIEEIVQDFLVMTDEAGNEVVYMQTMDGRLLLHAGGATRELAADVENVYFTADALESTHHRAPDTIFFTRAHGDLQNTVSLFKLQDCVETRLLEGRNANPWFLMENGDVIAGADSCIWTVGEGRTEKLDLQKNLRVPHSAHLLPMALKGEHYDIL